jgi:diaminopimelate decarboxylase
VGYGRRFFSGSLDVASKTVPFSESEARAIAAEYPTPIHIYDEAGIRKGARDMRAGFADAGLAGYRNYFAVKALPNPSVMKIAMDEGMGFDCSSLAELMLCERVGAHNNPFPNGFSRLMFTSNETPANEYAKALELGAIINLDDITHIDYFQREVGPLPEFVCCRYNPGPMRTFSKANDFIIGNPADAKFGMTRDQLLEAYAAMRDAGVKRFGLHTMVASNEIHSSAFVETARMLLELVNEISDSLGVQFDMINLGGGFGVAYKPEDEPLVFAEIANGIADVYRELVTDQGRHPVTVVTENGRVVTGPHGYLLTSILHTKSTYHEYLGVDATMANLMRPGMYGAYHHISVLGKSADAPTQTYDVVGSLCENNDKFAQDRELPECGPGDLMVIHDSGAHGHAMGFNYNGKLRSAEVLLCEDGSTRLVRRAETYNDLFATLDGL